MKGLCSILLAWQLAPHSHGVPSFVTFPSFRWLCQTEVSTTRTGGGIAVCYCLTISVKLNLDVLHSVYSLKWMLLPLISLLTIFHLYMVDLLHSDTAMLQIPSLHVIFRLHSLPGLMPFLNCFKVWVGDLTHSLKQYMWKSKQLIFMPKYCCTHCIKIATR